MGINLLQPHSLYTKFEIWVICRCRQNHFHRKKWNFLIFLEKCKNFREKKLDGRRPHTTCYLQAMFEMRIFCSCQQIMFIKKLPSQPSNRSLGGTVNKLELEVDCYLRLHRLRWQSCAEEISNGWTRNCHVSDRRIISIFRKKTSCQETTI